MQSTWLCKKVKNILEPKECSKYEAINTYKLVPTDISKVF